MSENSITDKRLSELERQYAAQSTDIRGIYAGLDEIRDVLVRMQESAKPNLGGMFLVLLATCTFLVTIGGLTMAPVYREVGRLTETQAAQDVILADRARIMGRMEAQQEYFQFEIDNNELVSRARDDRQNARLERLIGLMVQSIEKTAKLEGAIK